MKEDVAVLLVSFLLTDWFSSLKWREEHDLGRGPALWCLSSTSISRAAKCPTRATEPLGLPHACSPLTRWFGVSEVSTGDVCVILPLFACVRPSPPPPPRIPPSARMVSREAFWLTNYLPGCWCILITSYIFLKNRKAEQSWNSRSTCLNVSSFSSLCSTWDGERLSTMLLPAGRTLLLFLLPSLTASSCSPDRLLLWRTTIATHRNKEFCA